MIRSGRVVLGTAFLLGNACGLPAQRPVEPRTPVLMISIDGMHPSYVLEADRLGLRIPNLRRLLSTGTHASGVQGVVPTVTYPSHTTLVTGVSPARHGVTANTTFDPLGKNAAGWYWYAEDVKVPTLWDAATAARMTTANVHWPVTVGANITWNIPQVWRTGEQDDRKLVRALTTPGVLEPLEKALHEPYADGNDETIEGDKRRARFAAQLLRDKHPALTLAYFTALDHVEHASGPYSKAALETLEQIDALAGELFRAAWKEYGGKMAVVVVSDHGFLPVARQVNLSIALRRAGLLTFVSEDSAKPVDWKAAVWASGGSAGIVLRDDKDKAARDKVGALLRTLAADTANGIANVIDASELHDRGGFSSAAFMVNLREGFTMGTNVKGPLVSMAVIRGMHGFLPDDHRLDASFFIAGPGIAHGRDLGRIDQRDVAPTVARLLGLALPMAEGRDVLSATSAVAGAPGGSGNR